MITKVINIHHKVPYDVYIGRGSIWGNQWSHLSNTKALYKVNTREEAIECYAKWIVTQPKLLRQLRFLVGKRLGCFCHPSLCHGHVLAKMAENYEYWEEVAERLESA